MKYKIKWYRDLNQENVQVYYTCSNCNHKVDIEDLFCRCCGMSFITGQTPRDKYKSGYDQAKKDIVNIITGGKRL